MRVVQKISSRKDRLGCASLNRDPGKQVKPAHGHFGEDILNN